MYAAMLSRRRRSSLTLMTMIAVLDGGARRCVQSWQLRYSVEVACNEACGKAVSQHHVIDDTAYVYRVGNSR